MTNKYTYSFNSKCPNNDQFIYYTVTIETEKMIMIEKIVQYCKKFTSAYHEEIADDLIERFGGMQTITAAHKHVKIETVRHEDNA